MAETSQVIQGNVSYCFHFRCNVTKYADALPVGQQGVGCVKSLMGTNHESWLTCMALYAC